MALSSLAGRALPERLRLPSRYWYNVARHRTEVHLGRLREFVPRDAVAVDVGANFGFYAYRLSRMGVRVEAFEPVPQCAAVIRSYGSPRISLHEVALSDRDGMGALTIPHAFGGAASWLATLRPLDSGDAGQVQETPLRRLDGFGFTNVGFIKVDVEGHETEVLRGAVQTLSACRPNLLVEIEQRHLVGSIDDVFALIRDAGYQGYFIRADRWESLSEFRVERDQHPFTGLVEATGHAPDGYVNNFLFVPDEAPAPVAGRDWPAGVSGGR